MQCIVHGRFSSFYTCMCTYTSNCIALPDKLRYLLRIIEAIGQAAMYPIHYYILGGEHTHFECYCSNMERHWQIVSGNMCSKWLDVSICVNILYEYVKVTCWVRDSEISIRFRAPLYNICTNDGITCSSHLWSLCMRPF